MANFIRNLGYVGSSMLMRDPDGIKNIHCVDRFPIEQLLNYPVTVNFSGRAIHKMDSEFRDNDNYSTINISANFKSGMKVHLFSINTNFFGRVQKDNHVNENATRQYYVAPFSYDSFEESYQADMYGERCFNLSQEEVRLNDIFTTFSAKYLLGMFSIAESYDFEPIYSISTKEQINLNLDVNQKNQWVLTLQQPGPQKA